MEKSIPALKKRKMYFFFASALIYVFGLFTSFACAQNILSAELLRFSLWFPANNAPPLQRLPEKGEKGYEAAIGSIKELAPFMLEGLVYGWHFTYTPSDKLRSVPEFFEVLPAGALDKNNQKLSYTDARLIPELNRLECWVEYSLSEAMVQKRLLWQSPVYPKIKGEGSSPVMNGAEGIKEACRQALKNAVRSYARGLLKNKPKEIRGSVLLMNLPRYYIKSGKYHADLDFFLFVSKIEEYTQF